MARINRSDVIQKAVNDLGISTSGEKIPNETLDKVQCTFNLNRQFSNFVATNNTTSSGTLTVTMPTIDARSEIYITNIIASFAKDASCDVATGRIGINVTPNEAGIAKEIVGFSTITLTADSQNISIPLPYPLKLKANTNVTFGITFAAGLCSRFVSVVGFITSTN